MAERRYDRQGDQPRQRPRSRSGSSGHSADQSRSTTRRGTTSGKTRGGARTTGTGRGNSAGSPPRRPPAGRRPAKGSQPPRRGWRWLKGLLLVMLLIALAVGVTGCAVYASMSKQLPDPDLTKAKGRDQSTVITDRKGQLLTRLYADQNREDVALDRIPVHLRQAVIATEDRRFYEHEGVDPMGIARALVVDTVKGKKAQGGSTITQQYVKQAFVTSEKTLKRKLQEAILAQKVERRFSKDEILELYLNTIYFGHGAYGVDAASRAYFGKHVDKLTLAEAALIAGVIKSPGRYSPYLEPEAAQLRRDTVLKQMLDQGFIDQAQYDKAIATPVKVRGLKKSASRAPYFVEWIKEQLVTKYGEKLVYRGGLKVRTTLDADAQAAAEKAVGDILNQKSDPSAAVVAIKPGSGEVIAMVGGRDFKTQQFNVATQGRRQPGSSFKPFVLATALDQGVSPEATFESGPMKLDVGSGQQWSVTGAGGGRRGPMRLSEATAKSVNSVYAQLIMQVGADKVVETAEKMGITSDLEPMPAIALGGLERGVSPLEMANAYATLAANGTKATPFGISEVRGSDGKVLFKAKRHKEDGIDADVAALTTHLLRGVISGGTGTAAEIGRPAAGKTGTTQQYRDAWFVGYTPDLATAVWVGYPESQKEMLSVHGRQVTGGSFPAEIWARFMKAALAGVEEHEFVRPASLKRIKICTESGGLATEFCPKTANALVLADHQPDKCEKHKTPIEVKVPQLVGLTKVDALAKIERLTLTAKVVETDVAGVAAGTVAQQTPAAGTTVKSKSVVTFVVSTGKGSNKAPVAAFSVPSQIKTNHAAAFDGSASSDVDGRIARYYWEFGDGATAEGAKVSHTWSAPGTFEVTLWVTDNTGQQASITKTVTVK